MFLSEVFPKLLCAGLLIGLAGCVTKNPSMPMTAREARLEIVDLRRTPVVQKRPLVVISGFNDFGIPSYSLAPKFRRIFTAPEIVRVSMQGCHTFEACADRLVKAVEAKFPSKSAKETVEVDVVAVSMGGLVSRYAATPQPGRKRLAIKRLFTISTPHQGADLAGLPAFEEVQTDMRFGSPFLRKLNETKPSYEIFPYVRIGDVIVGAKNTALCGESPWWVPPEDVSPAHGFAYDDDRIFLDIALRLRGEKPVSTLPRTPLPR